MSIGSLDAISAYGRNPIGALSPLARSSDSGSGSGSGAVGATSFGAMIGNMVTETSGNLRAAEKASAQQVAGKGNLIDVVTAIGAAETALDTMVAVRDRVVNAYGEIMRMQI
jgi:flagellar hook-basal body complex protein FliE